MNKINVGGLSVCNVTMAEAVSACLSILESDTPGAVYTPNAEMAKAAFDDPAFMRVLNSGALVIPDGAGVILASKLLKTPLKEKVAGCDLAYALLPQLEKQGIPLFLFGGKPGVAERAAENLRKEHPGLIFAGLRSGYFQNDQEPLQEIARSGAKVVFVCIGFPKQEFFIHRYLAESGATLMLGLGGTMDVMAGEVKRAPAFFVKCNLEWLYRGVLDPKRYKRLLKIPLFLIDVLNIKQRSNICK